MRRFERVASSVQPVPPAGAVPLLRAGVVLVAMVAALAAAGCGDSETASPTPSTPTTSTVLNTPRVTAVSPTSGADSGGNIVTISGDYFSTASIVKIGGAPALNVAYISSTELRATTPAGAVGAADITVTVGSLTGTLAGGFTYLAPVDCALTFTVYNHTAGRLGGWTATLPSGTQATLAIGALGEVIDEAGNVVQKPIPVDSADSARMVLRAGAQNGRVGAFVAGTTSGSLTFQVPLATKAAFDIFVMNAANGTDYSVVDTSTLAYARNTTISRGADVGGATGPDGAVSSLASALAEAVSYPWMNYGRVARVAADGQIFVAYTAPNADACVTYTRSKGMMYVNPERCAAVPVDVAGAMVENGIEMLAGVRDLSGTDSAGLLFWDSLRLTPVARDLLAYVYLKDGKDW
jgi:hypothetical protein